MKENFRHLDDAINLQNYAKNAFQKCFPNDKYPPFSAQYNCREAANLL